MLLVGGAIFTLTINPGKFISEHPTLINEVSSYGIALDRIGMFKHTPEDALEILSNSVPLSGDAQLLLLSKNNRVVANTDKPIIDFKSTESFQPFRDAFGKMLKERHIDVRLLNKIVIVGPFLVKIYPNKTYYLFLLKHKGTLIWARLWSATQNNPLYLLMAVIASGIFCLVLTQHLKWSLKQLQKTVQKIAAGDLSARVYDRFSYQGDEIGKLSESIDKMADRIEKLVHQKQRLLRDVSHELRSPLTRLKISNALAYKKTGKVAEAECKRIDREIDRLDNLIGHIIHWSRVSSGLFSEGKETFSLNEVLRETTSNADFEAESMGKRVRFKENDTITLTGSAQGLASTFENIIRNALRFTPEKSTVRITLESSQQYAKVSIRDFGPGVPEESLPMLFEPFYRVDETRGGDNNGSGLGMAICKAIIENHKGSVTAKNMRPGLCVTIMLPLV